jgi:hypothetical protein
MTKQCNRRSFVKIGAAAGTAWAVGRACFAADASDVKAGPIDTVRVGLVGIGRRGSLLLSLLLDLEGVEVRAVCDLIPQRVAKAQDMVTTAKQPKPTGYSRGETDFERLCETEELDLDVYDAATWSCITELSQESVANRSSAMDFPDFTRGHWKTTPPIGIIGS